MRDLAGKAAFITGAASGIGRGMAQAFAEAGMRLALADLEAEPLAELVAELRDEGAEVHAHALDVSDRAAVMDAATQVAADLGKLHVLCNNAGVGSSAKPLDAETAGNWDWLIGVNLMGVVNGLLAFLPLIREHGEGGHIVNTSSMSGLRIVPGNGQGIYATTKFAILGLSEALREDMEPLGIGVSVLCPGFVKSQLYESGRNRPQRFGGVFTRPADHPLGAVRTAGLDALAVGRRVLLAIEENEFYIITHPEHREDAAARLAEISAAFERAAELGFFD